MATAQDSHHATVATIKATPELSKKLVFIEKYSKAVQVCPDSLLTENIQIKLPQFCEVSFGISADELIELLRHSNSFKLTDSEISYQYRLTAQMTEATISRTVQLKQLDYTLTLPSILGSVRIVSSRVSLLTRDELLVSLYAEDSLLVLESFGFIRTRAEHPIEFLDSPFDYSCTIKASSIRMLQELEGDTVISFFRDLLIVYVFEPGEIVTAISIRPLAKSIERRE